MTGVLAAYVLGLAGLGALPMLQPGTTPPGAESPDNNGAETERRFEARLEAFDRAIAGVTDLRANFRQEKHTPLLRRPMVSTGTVLVRGERARWDTREPRPSTMTLAAGEIRIYYPDARVVEIYQAQGEMREVAASPLPRLKDLRERFEIREIPAIEVDGGADADMFAARLEPRNDGLREHIDFIRVLIDPATPCIRILEIVDPDGERTRVELTDVRVSTGIKDEELALTPPKGVREIRPGGGGR